MKTSVFTGRRDLGASVGHGGSVSTAPDADHRKITYLGLGYRSDYLGVQDFATYSQTVYDEYGKVESELSPDIPRFGFTGHQRGPAEDPDLYYAQQRYYNAATGRFVSEDPLWGQSEKPLSLHRYLYAYANPTVYVDPDGRAVVLSQIRNFFAQRRQDATEASIRLRQSAFANQGVVSDLTTRTGAVLTAVGGGIFGLGEAGFGVLNTGANLVGSATGLISDQSIGELDNTFRTAEAVVSGAQQFGRTLIDNPVETGRRGASAVGQFGYDAFIAGDPRAQANLGVALPGLIGGSGAVRVSAQGLRGAGDSVRQVKVRFAERIARGREADALVTASEARSLRIISETPDGGAFDPQLANELLLRARAGEGDMRATRTLISKGLVPGLELVPNSNAIRRPRGRFVSYETAMERASDLNLGILIRAVDTRVADRSATADRFTPVLANGGRPNTTSPRTRAGMLTESALRVMERSRKATELQGELKKVLDQIEF